MPKIYNSYGEPGPPKAEETFPYRDIEAAMIVWEEMIHRSRSQPSDDAGPMELLEGLGPYEMRAHAFAIARWAGPIWEAGFRDGDCPFDGCQFDWDFIPAILDMVGWQGGCSIVPAGTPEQLVPIVLERMGVAHAIARCASWTPTGNAP